MATLQVLREAFVNRIQGSVASTLKGYTSDSPWLDEFAGGQSHSIATTLELRRPLKLLEPEDGDLKDLENTRRVHKALPALTLLQAREPRLWTRLSHIELWSYMRKRWPVERYLSDRQQAERFVLTRYFVPQSQSRALLRNGVARLWWYARLTYDEHRDDPYELTGVLLHTLDITQQILERSLGRTPHVLAGFLEFLLQHEDTLLSGGNKSRETIRRLAKALNLRGGACIWDSLSKADVTAFLDEELNRIEEQVTVA